MYIIGIAGGSGSGKTTFTHKVLNQVNDPRVAVLHQDAYYLAQPPPDLKIHEAPNFDHPEAFDWELLRTHLAQIKNGELIEMPTYDYASSRRTLKTETVGPCDILLVEGIFALWDEGIRELMDYKCFLHVEADIRFIRRLFRDLKDRGRTLEDIIRQYYETVRPMHNLFLEPTQQYADIVVGEETDKAAYMLAAMVKQKLIDMKHETQHE